MIALRSHNIIRLAAAAFLAIAMLTLAGCRRGG